METAKTSAPVKPVTPAAPELTPAKAAAAEAATALAEAKAARADLDQKVGMLAKYTAAPATDDDDVRAVAVLADDIGATVAKVEAAAAKADAAASRAAAAGGATPAPEALQLIGQAQGAAKEALGLVKESGELARKAKQDAEAYTKLESGDPAMYLSAGEASIAAGKYGDAKRDLDKATKAYKAAGTSNPALDFAYARLYDKMADKEKDGGAKAKLLKRAKGHYDAFAKTATGPRAGVAKERSGEIDEELKELSAP
jgi:hypothetical protein